MDDRSRERVLLAASRCEPKDYREAALIGAIAHVLIDTGHFLPHQVAAVAADRMGWGLSVATDLMGPQQALRAFRTRGYPSLEEVARAARVFKAEYDPPGLGAVACPDG